MVTLAQPTRRERRREETRKRIFETALDLFAKHGFNKVTVEQITEAADVGKGTFFNYFPTKEHMFLALAERQQGFLHAAVDAAKKADSVRPVLFELAHRLSSGPARSQLMLRSLLGSVLNNDQASEKMRWVLAYGREALAAIMERGQALGELRRELPAQQLARMFQTLLFGTHTLWSLHPPADLYRWVEESVEFFWCNAASVGGKGRQGKGSVHDEM
jgi:AcrR family transcriptional regulator